MKKFLVLIISVSLVLGLVACGSPATTDAPEEVASVENGPEEVAPDENGPEEVTPDENGPEEVASADGAPTIAFVPRVVGQAWWDHVRDNGVMAWAEQHGIDVIYQGPANVEVEGQIQIIHDLMAQGIDVLLFAPNDSAALEPIAAEARERGIIVITTEGSGMQNVDFNVEAFNEEGFGAFMMDQLASFMGYEGYYVTMVGSMTSESHMNWADAAVARQLEMYPDMTLVPTARVSSEHDAEIAFQRTMELLQLYPELRGIQGTGSFDAPGAARAIRELGLVGEVHVMGGTIPSEIRDFLHEGIMQGGALWDPALTAQAMLNLAMMMWDGEAIATGANLGIPGYDDVIVEGTLVIGDGAIAITVDNVDDFGF